MFSPKTDNIPFTLRRAQFPVRLAFAMSINKAQGQSLNHVGIDLTTPVFAHGQLYVALSRATNVACVAALLPENAATRTRNVVYHEVFGETSDGNEN